VLWLLYNVDEGLLIYVIYITAP